MKLFFMQQIKNINSYSEQILPINNYSLKYTMICKLFCTFAVYKCVYFLLFYIVSHFVLVQCTLEGGNSGG